ncbi:MAG: lipoate--protein ligase [Spirochaetales bacterium]|nr:lipoate--protein ligase [Spirochaetales bacterium]
MGVLKVYISKNQNPWFNLAAEDYILRTMEPSDRILMLYRNRASIVIGRFQNPWLECNIESLNTRDVLLARRQSGGGTVYHDLGNTNFTFFSGMDRFDKDKNIGIIVQALKKLGIPAKSLERSDIIVEGKKISGSAFKQKRDRAFHHGTLLINADLNELSILLHPPHRNISAKGVPSFSSPVVNLSEYRSDLDHLVVCDAIIKAFAKSSGGEVGVGARNIVDNGLEVVTLDEPSLLREPAFMEYYNLLSSWEWLYGKTPVFRQRIYYFDDEKIGSNTGDAGICGVRGGRFIENGALHSNNGVGATENQVEIELVVRDGLIESVELKPEDFILGKLLHSMIGTRYVKAELSAALLEGEKNLPEADRKISGYHEAIIRMIIDNI